MDAQLVKTEERLSKLMNACIKSEDKLNALIKAYKDDMRRIRDVLTDIIEGS